MSALQNNYFNVSNVCVPNNVYSCETVSGNIEICTTKEIVLHMFNDNAVVLNNACVIPVIACTIAMAFFNCILTLTLNL